MSTISITSITAVIDTIILIIVYVFIKVINCLGISLQLHYTFKKGRQPMNTTVPSEDQIELQHFSSDINIDMNREFVYWNYPLLRKSNSPVYGAASSKEVVFQPLDIDSLCYLLMSKGTYMILFGGVWSSATQSVIDQVNYYARKHGVDTIYLFDFSADGTAGGTIKQDIRAHEKYIGSDKKESNPFAIYNYIYGEIVTRYLTNLNDWVDEKIGSGNDITYLNLYQDAVTVPNLTEPFLFIYDSENTENNSGCRHLADYYPIVWAAELKEASEHTGEELEDKIFSHIKKDECVITPYTYADYIRESFAMNKRGHAFKTEDCFKAGEQINLCRINFQVFRWILQQKGSFVFVLAGPWCVNSQAAAPVINDCAVANNTRVYMTDIRLDGKHPIDFWKYPRKNQLTMGCPPMLKYEVELWEKFLPAAPVMTSINPNLPYDRHVTTEYTDEDGKVHSILNVGIPYLFAYNTEHKDWSGHRRPLLATYHNESFELINCSENFIYHAPNYREYKAGTYQVFYAYKKDMGETPSHDKVDRTAPVVPGEPVQHVETVAYYKHHDWYQDDESAPKANGGC